MPRLAGALIGEAWTSIGSNRLRTLLAMLGIIIGVASVVLLLAIGSGSRRVVEERIAKMGSNLLVVYPGSSDNKGIRQIDSSAFDLDVAKSISQLDTVMMVAPYTFPRSYQISNGKSNEQAQVTGTTENYFAARNWSMLAGESYNAEDVRLLKTVAVIGVGLAEKLFPESVDEPDMVIGRNIRIESTNFRIIGVLMQMGASMDGRNQDEAVYVPLTTGKKRLWAQNFIRGSVQSMFIKSYDKDMLPQTEEDVIQLLRRLNKLGESDANDFTVRNLAAITKMAADTSQALSLLLGAIASISLVVGGIGIMNIMLVTVTERTREIGIRKAIGATQGQIMIQFLMEAVMMCCVGSGVGLAVGLSGGVAAEYFFRLTVDFDASILMLVAGVAGGIGLASGLYPALKAARMQPIEALRTIGG